MSRRCLSLLGDRTWQDECLVTVGDHQITSLVVSLCPVNTICMNDQIEGMLTSLCIPRPAANADPNTPEQQQTGYYPVEGTTAPVQNPAVSVTLAKPIALACVSAMIEGTISPIDLHLLLTVANYEGVDGDYIIEPDSPLVGTIRGGDKICDYNATNRDCVPTGPFSLNTGAIIDFSFGLGIQQLGRFYYAINGHGY